jgi:hypothetical protein
MNLDSFEALVVSKLIRRNFACYENIACGCACFRKMHFQRCADVLFVLVAEESEFEQKKLATG